MPNFVNRNGRPRTRRTSSSRRGGHGPRLASVDSDRRRVGGRCATSLAEKSVSFRMVQQPPRARRSLADRGIEFDRAELLSRQHGHRLRRAPRTAINAAKVLTEKGDQKKAGKVVVQAAACSRARLLDAAKALAPRRPSRSQDRSCNAHAPGRASAVPARSLVATVINAPCPPASRASSRPASTPTAAARATPERIPNLPLRRSTNRPGPGGPESTETPTDLLISSRNHPMSEETTDHRARFRSSRRSPTSWTA